MKKQFCEVCMLERNMKRIEIEEKIEIRGVTLNVVHEYDKCVECNELFEPYENVDKNLLKDYSVYREKVGYIQPDEIKAIRNSYKFTIREFAEVLGIGYSTLSNIENGALQNEYQNTLFQFSASPSAMYKVVMDKKDFLESNVNESIKILASLCIHEEPHLKELKTKINDKVIHVTQKLNTLEYDIDQITNANTTTEYKKEEKKTWTENFSNMILQN